MIKLTKDSKVYVYCPGNVVTGGAELLHQLTHVLNNKGFDAYMFYFDGAKKTPNEYEHYTVKTVDILDDQKENVVVLYEAIFDKSKNHTNCQLILWWLSVDHFFMYSLSYLSLRDYFKWDINMAFEVILKRLGYLFLKKRNYFKKNISIDDLTKLNALNCFQSDYAKHFLLRNGFKNLLPLSDFINSEFYNESIDNTEKKDIVLYNPKKGLEYTKILISKTPNLKWIPLQGMTRRQLMDTFKKSKLYVDFGYHPGKDRIPREAVLNGCCVVTGVLGSAAHYEDIPISEIYKIDQKKVEINVVVDRIEDILRNYHLHIENFEFYRQKTLAEEKIFEKEVLQVFSI